MSYALIAVGFTLGVLPTMLFQVWNGASLLGCVLAVIGSTLLWKEVGNVSG